MDLSFHLNGERCFKLLVQIIVKWIREILILGSEELELAELGEF